MDAAEEERKRFERKYGAAPKGKTLVGFKSGKALWGDEDEEDEDELVDNSNLRTAKTMPSVAKTTSTPKPEIDLEKRKELAGVLKQFARGEIKTDPEGLVSAGEEIGVSRDQIRSLYNQYRNEFRDNPPENYPNKGELASVQTGMEQVDGAARRDREWNDNFGSQSLMQASRRSIESPEGEARRLFKKAYDMKIDPSTLVAKEGGLSGAVKALKDAFGSSGIRTAEETKARKELGAEQRRKEREQRSAFLKKIKEENPLDEEEED